MLPKVLPLTQLWQGTTSPPGATAIFERHAPQTGELGNPSPVISSALSQPGDVNEISDFNSLQTSTAFFNISLSSAGVSALPAFICSTAPPVGMRLEHPKQ
jgi:hypothetical protein